MTKTYVLYSAYPVKGKIWKHVPMPRLVAIEEIKCGKK